jgi:hypothetical protein
MSTKWAAVAAGAAVVALLIAGFTLAHGSGKSNAPRVVTSTVSHNVDAPSDKQNRPTSHRGDAADESDPTGDDRSDEGSDNEGSDNQAGDNRGGAQP